MLKRENETNGAEGQEDTGKKNDGFEGKTAIDKSRGNVLGERPKVFYCALMLWINVIINK